MVTPWLRPVFTIYKGSSAGCHDGNWHIFAPGSTMYQNLSKTLYVEALHRDRFDRNQFARNKIDTQQFNRDKVNRPWYWSVYISLIEVRQDQEEVAIQEIKTTTQYEAGENFDLQQKIHMDVETIKENWSSFIVAFPYVNLHLISWYPHKIVGSMPP